MARKKKETISIKPVEIVEKPEAVYIYHDGDDITKISKILTGKKYLSYKLLAVNGLTMGTLKDGDVLKWEI